MAFWQSGLSKNASKKSDQVGVAGADRAMSDAGFGLGVWCSTLIAADLQRAPVVVVFWNRADG